jgi:arsenate reductase (thioredoxin)
MISILVLCTGNTARSQIAEALLLHRGGGRIVAASAGSRPGDHVSPYAVQVLADHGITWSARHPKSLDAVAGPRYDLVITVCDDAAEACPFFPGAAAQVHWGLQDPAVEREPDAARRAFAATYDALSRRIDRFLALPLETLGPAELARRAASIHAEAGAAEVRG